MQWGFNWELGPFEVWDAIGVEKSVAKLKEEGKTIIAVTHDDAYFKHADRILKFDYGQIIMDKKVTDGVVLDSSLWK